MIRTRIKLEESQYMALKDVAAAQNLAQQGFTCLP